MRECAARYHELLEELKERSSYSYSDFWQLVGLRESALPEIRKASTELLYEVEKAVFEEAVKKGDYGFLKDVALARRDIPLKVRRDAILRYPQALKNYMDKEKSPYFLLALVHSIHVPKNLKLEALEKVEAICENLDEDKREYIAEALEKIASDDSLPRKVRKKAKGILKKEKRKMVNKL